MPLPPPRLTTTMLFIPGNAPDKIAKMPRLEARAFILDLEDAVPSAEKATARETIAQAIQTYGPQLAVHVRVNPIDSPHFFDDVEAAVRPGIAGINVPKTTSAHDVVRADQTIRLFERRAGLAAGSVELMTTVETAAGIDHAFEIAAASPRLRRMCFGAGDFTLDLGLAWPDPSGQMSETVIAAKSRLVVASRVAGIETPHDSVFPRYDSQEALRLECEHSKRLGFTGKHAIHPRQLATIEAAFAPTEAEVQRARRMVQAFAAAEADGRGAVGVDGELVDYPILYRAQQILASAGAKA